MYVPFNTIPQTSRIWIYQSDKKFSPQHTIWMQDFLTQYCDSWRAHRSPLNASFDIKMDHFIILAVNELVNATSGCSVDDSVRAIKSIEQQTGLNFFNRNQIGFLNKNEVFFLDLPKLKEKFAEGIWNESTLTFNNLVTSKQQLEGEWVVPAGNTWLKRYVPRETLKT